VTIARTLFVFSLALWIGAVVFFSLVVLPVLFTSWDAPRAGAVAALLFPMYYRTGLALGVILLGAAGYLAVRARGPWRIVLAAVAVMVLCQSYATLSLHPTMAAIRESTADRPRFEVLHRRSVRLNGVVLAGGIVLLLSSGYLLGRR
jgi:hypothetical protein